jgi:hypothetical protein
MIELLGVDNCTIVRLSNNERDFPERLYPVPEQTVRA